MIESDGEAIFEAILARTFAAEVVLPISLHAELEFFTLERGA